ncbi:MAG: hypothetical protein IT371_21395 [Deltaproteobacteria bacterium]|nr:hypothetical protein [Deltaproteobacteria bacterium]
MAPDGFVHTRLAAMLLPGTLVGPLNGALETHKVRVAACAPGLLTLTLAMPRVADRAAAEELAGRLRGTGLFADVAPTYVVSDPDFEPRPVPKADASATPVTGLGQKKAALRPPSSPSGEDLAHHEAMRLPAAWNLKALVIARPVGTLNLLIPGQFATANAHPDISSQRFVDTGGFVLSGTFDGSGVYLSSVAAADFNGSGLTGMNAKAGESMITWGVPLGTRWDYSQIHTATLDAAARMEPTGRTVLLWRHTWNNLSFAQLSKLQRVGYALTARLQAKLLERRLLVVSSAGKRRAQGTAPPPEETAVWNSAFNLDANGGDFTQLFTEAERQQADVQRILGLSPEQNRQRSLNLLVAGATVAGGWDEASFSAQPSEVRAVGEAIPGYCEPSASLCASGRLLVSSTVAAAAQLAGLAAWLWNLNWNLEGRTIAALPLLSFEPARLGTVNAYWASLTGVGSLNESRRATLMDLVGGGASGNDPDGRFDEKDLAIWEQKMTSWSSGRVFDRYDLNGDGYTVPDEHPEAFDLDGSGPPFPAVGEVAYIAEGARVTLDEGQVEDLEVLCYYAYSSIYQGDADRRKALLGTRCKLPTVRIAPRQTTVRAKLDVLLEAIVENGNAADLRWSADGGTLRAQDGSTTATWTAPDVDDKVFSVKVWLTSRPRRPAVASIRVTRCPPPPTCAPPDDPIVSCKLRDECNKKDIVCDCKPERGKTEPRSCNPVTFRCEPKPPCNHACPTVNATGCDGTYLSLCEADENGCRRWKHLESCARPYYPPQGGAGLTNNRFCYPGHGPVNGYPADYLVSAPRCACRAEYHLQDPCFSNKTGWVCWRDIHSTSPNPYAWKLCAMDPVGACAIVTHDGPGGLASCTPPYP